jgi:hypothetical protein
MADKNPKPDRPSTLRGLSAEVFSLWAAELTAAAGAVDSATEALARAREQVRRVAAQCNTLAAGLAEKAGRP